MTTRHHPTEFAYQNIVLTTYIRAKPSEKWPVGHIHVHTQHPGAGWLPCDGSFHLIRDYPELYMVIGNSYCPRHVERPVQISRLHRFWLWLTDQPVPTVVAPNLKYRPGMFRLPSLPGGEW